MRRLACCLSALCFVAMVCALPVAGQPDSKSPYKIEFDQNDVQMLDRDKDGKEGVFVQVKFTISDIQAAGEGYMIDIYENDKKVKRVDLPRNKTVTTDLSVIMAIDTSGSMKQFGR